MHPAVLTYRSARKKDFYKVESTVDGKNFVTARGWDDLSEMIKLYEENDLTVNEKLVAQYLQDRKIAKDFSIYYDLFNKYKSDDRIDAILDGNPGEDVLFRAQRAPIDERLSFLGLLFDAVTGELRKVCEKEDMLDLLAPALRKIRTDSAAADAPSMPEILDRYIADEAARLEKGRKSSALSPSQQRCIQMMMQELDHYRAAILTEGIAADNAHAFERIRQLFRESVGELRSLAARGTKVLDNAFRFCEDAFEDGDEILIFVTELTVNYHTARFIGHYGCDRYYMHNKELQFAERQAELSRRVGEFNWDF